MALTIESDGRAIFLDRDGVINQNRRDHVKSWAEFEFVPGALDALRRLAQLNLPIIVITNQGAIGRGLTTFEAVDEIHARMVLAVQAHGGRIDDVLYCPHKPDDRCDCRKPQPGMLKLAAQRWQIDLSQSFLIGDADTDILAGQAVGCRGVLVLTGRGRERVAQFPQLGLGNVPCVEDLHAAVLWIEQTLAGLHDVAGAWNAVKTQQPSPQLLSRDALGPVNLDLRRSRESLFTNH